MRRRSMPAQSIGPVMAAANYNSLRIHKTLRITPAMAAKVTERLWEMNDVVDVLEAWEAANGK
jgi:hypothetical protein